MPSHAHPVGYYTGTISRIDPDTNQTVSQTPVPEWIRSHVTLTDQGTDLGLFAVGPGGLTWFSIYNSGHIQFASFNVITGALHTFELPVSFPTQPASGTPALPPEALAQMNMAAIVAPDGSLWVIAHDVSSRQTTIYRYTPEGQVSSFPNPGQWEPTPGGQGYVTDQYNNLCALLQTPGPYTNGNLATLTYQCLSPQGVLVTFGTSGAGQHSPGCVGGTSLNKP